MCMVRMNREILGSNILNILQDFGRRTYRFWCYRDVWAEGGKNQGCPTGQKGKMECCEKDDCREKGENAWADIQGEVIDDGQHMSIASGSELG